MRSQATDATLEFDEKKLVNYATNLLETNPDWNIFRAVEETLSHFWETEDERKAHRRKLLQAVKAKLADG
ncbi:MAG: hypothetical protein MRY49_00200 [Candidatus Pacebacteria bacterium]|nr:hypothetical protein [Candidatus Paceibacterota bacterium]